MVKNLSDRQIAASKIQKLVRNYLRVRKAAKVQKAVLTIQRWIRGHMGRKRAREMKLAKWRQQRIQYYDFRASKIQALWRGY